MFEKILVALDDSTPADAVVAVFQQIQLSAAHQVVLTHVIALPPEDADATHSRSGMDIDPQQAEERLQHYQALLPCPSQTEVVQGEPVTEIIRLARIYQVDLIILGSRGLTGLKRILQGSVSSQVLEAAPCSVLVIKVA